MQSSDHFSTKGSIGIILNRTTNSLEEKTRHTKDFYVNQEAQWIENAITKKTQKLMGINPENEPKQILTIAQQEAARTQEAIEAEENT